jgi:hypothetical protein
MNANRGRARTEAFRRVPAHVMRAVLGERRSSRVELVGNEAHFLFLGNHGLTCDIFPYRN